MKQLITLDSQHENHFLASLVHLVVTRMESIDYGFNVMRTRATKLSIFSFFIL